MINNIMNQGETKHKKYWPTVLRVVIFWILCAMSLAVFSGIIPGKKGHWLQIEIVLSATIIALIFARLFARWEGLGIKDIGIGFNRKSISKYFMGTGIGLLLASLQPVLVLLTGHIKFVFNPGISVSIVMTSFLLYLSVGLREEVAFRSYPLFSLNLAAGPLPALIVVGIIFITEHVAGGMTWWTAILGSGTGSLVFGLAALRKNGIALPIGIHSAWNFGQCMWGFKNEPGILQTVVEKGYEGRVAIIGWASYLLVMALVIVLLYRSCKK